MIRRPPRSTQSRSSAASDVYKRQDAQCCQRVRDTRVPENLPVGEPDERRAARGDHSQPLCAGRDLLRVPKGLQMHLQRLLPCIEDRCLALQCGCGERELLHVRVEQQQSDNTADQHQRHQADEGDPGRLLHAAGYDGQPGTFDGRLCETGYSVAGLAHQSVHATAPVLVRTRSTARSRTDAARGFSSISCADAFSDPRVTSRSAGSWPAGTMGMSGGTMLLVCCAKACLTSLSSSEW